MFGKKRKHVVSKDEHTTHHFWQYLKGRPFCKVSMSWNRPLTDDEHAFLREGVCNVTFAAEFEKEHSRDGTEDAR